MGYAGSNGLEPQQFVSNNQPCGYICYGFGEFDGQGSGHDFSGNVSLNPSAFFVLDSACREAEVTAVGHEPKAEMMTRLHGAPLLHHARD